MITPHGVYSQRLRHGQYGKHEQPCRQVIKKESGVKMGEGGGTVTIKFLKSVEEGELVDRRSKRFENGLALCRLVDE